MRKIVLILIVILSILGFSAKAKSGSVTLAWDPTSSIDPRETGYKIYIGFKPRMYIFKIDVGNVLRYKVLHLSEDGTVYYFAATAYFKDGTETTYSNEVSAKAVPNPEDIPQNLRRE